MDQMERVPCPYCREMILPGAVKCKECGSNLGGAPRNWMPVSPRLWVRNQPNRKLLGVASCIALNLRVSATLVRLTFVLLTFVSLLGLFLYIALALIIPPAPGQRSAFEALVDMMGAAVDSLRQPGARTAMATSGTQAGDGASAADSHTGAPPADSAQPQDITTPPPAAPPNTPDARV